jgi:membrane protease YdiL (CAAX protease family)
MSDGPDHDPQLRDGSEPGHEDSATHDEVFKAVHTYFPYDLPQRALAEDEIPRPLEVPRVRQPAMEPEYTPWQPSIPNFAHILVLAGLALIGLLGSSLLVRTGIYFHLFGVTSVKGALTEIHYTIGSMGALYLITFAAALLVFPHLWHKSFFAGLQWNSLAALHRARALLVAASICFVLAMVDEIVLPGPTNAPIDKLFDSRAAAWLLFAFGVTFAPFFEELVFRGFLLPALCTGFDWTMEQATGVPARTPDSLGGHPQWSMGAMVFGAVATSVPFALMHAEQTAWSIGPFVLLVCVSLVLCWARLSVRSLAASVLVHASYNLLLFTLMLLGTQGFKHLDKM